MSRMLRMSEGDLAEFERTSGRPMAAASLKEMKRQQAEARITEARSHGRQPTKADLVTANEIPAPRALKAPSPSKYGAKPEVLDGIRFDSRLEAKRYRELVLLQKAGEIKYFLRQVPFDIPGARYFLDFLVVRFFVIGTARADVNPLNWSHLTYEDAKGVDTPVSALKRRQVEKLYGIKIDLVRKPQR